MPGHRQLDERAAFERADRLDPRDLPVAEDRLDLHPSSSPCRRACSTSASLTRRRERRRIVLRLAVRGGCRARRRSGPPRGSPRPSSGAGGPCAEPVAPRLVSGRARRPAAPARSRRRQQCRRRASEASPRGTESPTRRSPAPAPRRRRRASGRAPRVAAPPSSFGGQDRLGQLRDQLQRSLRRVAASPGSPEPATRDVGADGRPPREGRLRVLRRSEAAPAPSSRREAERRAAAAPRSRSRRPRRARRSHLAGLDRATQERPRAAPLRPAPARLRPRLRAGRARAVAVARLAPRRRALLAAGSVIPPNTSTASSGSSGSIAPAALGRREVGEQPAAGSLSSANARRAPPTPTSLLTAHRASAGGAAPGRASAR